MTSQPTHTPRNDREKTAVSIQIDDISAFAKSLRQQLGGDVKQTAMLSMIAKASGYRNYQHLRSQNAPQAIVDHKLVDRAKRAFDDQGQLVLWPAKTSVQALVLWVIWAAIPARQDMTERQISAEIDKVCVLKDAAQIRRSMVENNLLQRNRDGSCYTRVERAPSAEARSLIAAIVAIQATVQT